MHAGASPNAELCIDYETYPTLTAYQALGMAPTLTVSSTGVLAGLVDRVTFHNAENGACVLHVKARGQRDAITVIGHAAMISAGEFVQATKRAAFVPIRGCGSKVVRCRALPLRGFAAEPLTVA